MNQEEPEIRYWINGDDELVFVNEAWTRFAAQNDGHALIGSQVLGRPLWEFISDPVTRNLYQTMVARVRHGTTLRFTLRCDSPARRRLLSMRIAHLDDGIIEFATSLIGLRVRDTAVLEDCEIATTLNSCAWCSRLDPGNGEWIDLEDAAERLRLFHGARLPHLTHGICPTCLAAMRQTLDAPAGTPPANLPKL